MLSDILNDQNYNDEKFSSQLKKLEHISTNMSVLANNGDVEKIVHLDKLRKTQYLYRFSSPFILICDTLVYTNK